MLWPFLRLTLFVQTNGHIQAWTTLMVEQMMQACLAHLGREQVHQITSIHDVRSLKLACIVFVGVASLFQVWTTT